MESKSSIIQQRLEELLKKDQTHAADKERTALFLILSGNDDLYQKVEHIYDFKNHWIKDECLTSSKVDFSSGSKALIRLGFNLYNGYSPADIRDIFSVLDQRNIELALKAIEFRFNR